MKSTTKQIVHDTFNNIVALLSLIDDNESFRNEIKMLFQDVVIVWEKTQHSNKMLKASITNDFNDWQWQILKNFLILEIEMQSELKVFEKLFLFSCIWIFEKEHSVHRDFVILFGQNTVVAAKQELRQSMKKLKIEWNANNLTNSIKRERRLSMKIDERSEISLTSFINSRAEDKASSFLEAQWIQSRES